MRLSTICYHQLLPYIAQQVFIIKSLNFILLTFTQHPVFYSRYHHLNFFAFSELLLS